MNIYVDINIISYYDWKLDRGLRLRLKGKIIVLDLRKEEKKKRFVQLSHIRKTNLRGGELANKINEFAIH